MDRDVGALNQPAERRGKEGSEGRDTGDGNCREEIPSPLWQLRREVRGKMAFTEVNLLPPRRYRHYFYWYLW